MSTVLTCTAATVRGGASLRDGGRWRCERLGWTPRVLAGSAAGCAAAPAGHGASGSCAAAPRAHLLSAGLAAIALCESTSTSSLHQDTCSSQDGATACRCAQAHADLDGRRMRSAAYCGLHGGGKHPEAALSPAPSPCPQPHLGLGRDAARAAHCEPAGPHDVALERQRLQHALVAAKQGAEGGTRQAHGQRRLGGWVLDLWTRGGPDGDACLPACATSPAPSCSHCRLPPIGAWPASSSGDPTAEASASAQEAHPP